MNVSHLFTEDDRSEAVRAIGEAEKRTAAQIVCALATESGRYDRAEAWAGLLGSLVLLVGGTKIAAYTIGGAGGWADGDVLHLGWQSVLVAVGFVAGSVLASYCHPLRRLFVGQKEMREETDKAASHVFASRRLMSTRTQCGALIYISMFEHQVRVICDHAAFQAVDQEDLNRICEAAVVRMKRGEYSEGLQDAVRMAGEVFAEKFPGTGEVPGADELANELLLVHPRP